MKTLLLVFFSTVCITMLAQDIDKPYEFPVRPGMKEWEKLTSSKQKDEICSIPKHIVDKLSTEALFITCLKYPRLIDVFMGRNLQVGFDYYSKHFGGLEELISRSDLSTILLQSYLDINLKNAQIKKYDLNLNKFHIAFIEIMIAQDNVINQFNTNEKELLLAEAIMKLEQRRSFGESFYRQKTTAFVISRLLSSVNKKLSEIDNYGNDIFEVFNSHVILADSTVIDKLLVKSKEIEIR